MIAWILVDEKTGRTVSRVECSDRMQEAADREINAYLERCYDGREPPEPELAGLALEDKHRALLSRLFSTMILAHRKNRMRYGELTASCWRMPYSDTWIIVARYGRRPYRLEPIPDEWTMPGANIFEIKLE